MKCIKTITANRHTGMYKNENTNQGEIPTCIHMKEQPLANSNTYENGEYTFGVAAVTTDAAAVAAAGVSCRVEWC